METKEIKASLIVSEGVSNKNGKERKWKAYRVKVGNYIFNSPVIWSTPEIEYIINSETAK